MTTPSSIRTEGYVTDHSLPPQRDRAVRTGDFRAAVDDDRRSSPPRVLEAVASGASASTPAGLLVRGVVGLVSGQDASNPRREQIDDMWRMQAEGQAMNMEYLALQEAAQAENRHFTAMSNLMKARHDTAKAAISNIRV